GCRSQATSSAPKAQSSVQSSASKHPAKNCMVTWKAVENRAVPSSGVLVGQPSCEGDHQSWFYPDMNRCHCQRPPEWADGGSWRSGSPAASLSQPGMPGAVLDLCALRPRTWLLQSG